MAQLLARLAPEVEAILASHQLSHAEAEGALQELLLLLTYRWDQLESRDVWSLATLRRLCQRPPLPRGPSSD